MKTRHYSYSKINLFNSCSLKYKFIYIDKNYKIDESIEAFLGKMVHQTLEWIYMQKLKNNRSYYSLDSIIHFFKEQWEDNWHHSIRRFKYIKQKKADYFTRGINFLVKYYHSFGPHFNQKVFKVEEKFEFQLDGYNIKAIIDRIDRESDSGMHIIDYKTGKNMLDEKKLKKDMQMSIYALALVDQFPEIDNIKLSHYYLAMNKLVSIDSSKLDTNSFSSALIENIRIIEDSEKEGDFIANESKLCNWCYYWKECPVKSNNHPSEYLK